jgi:DNA-binding NarL/FixJ family response regulator
MIVDDHPIIREGLKLVIGDQPDLELAGEAATLLHDALPQAAIIIFSPHSREVYIHQVLQAGGLGYLLNEAPVSEVPEAIRTVLRGDYNLSPRINTDVIDPELWLNYSFPFSP